MSFYRLPPPPVRTKPWPEQFIELPGGISVRRDQISFVDVTGRVVRCDGVTYDIGTDAARQILDFYILPEVA